MAITYVDTIHKNISTTLVCSQWIPRKTNCYDSQPWFTCGWFIEARKHILAGDFRPWKEMMVKNMNQRL
jgi:queuine tRNA-ribosyltransferase